MSLQRFQIPDLSKQRMEPLLIYYKYDKMIVVYIIIIAAIKTNYNTNMFFNRSFHKND